jgi:CRISPR-associated protein Cmr1
MIKLEYQVQFTTPAFLGNAEQDGQWRTPPFKALLRQWWRAAYAAEHGFNVNIPDMRREEGLLFGNAWLSHWEGNRDVTDHCKSRVRIRLAKWDSGELRSWHGLEQETVYHPEAERARYQVGPHAYLGYGPLDGGGGTKFTRKGNAAIQAGDSANLSFAWPSDDRNAEIRRMLELNSPRIRKALVLMERYGTLGGRSRNGWGSFGLFPRGEDESVTCADATDFRPWRECLDRDWPHALGQDENGPLVWQIKGRTGDWRSLMRELAIIKIGLRTQFTFPNVAPPHSQPEPRHWLSYPITRHTTRAFSRNARLPNSLRFKVRSAPDDPQKLVGVVFQVPCRPPPEFHPDESAIVQTWRSVHALLDELTEGPGRRGYASIRDPARRAKLKPALDTVSLTRIPE